MDYYPITQAEMQTADFKKSCTFHYHRVFRMYDEVFVQISSFLPEVDDRYWVNTYGFVFDDYTKLLMPFSYNTNGYIEYSLRCKDWWYNKTSNRYVKYSAHRLTAMAFLGVPENKSFVVNHINCIRDSNHYANLEWCTQKDNIRHSLRLGRYGEGETYVSSKYTNDEVESICKLLQSGITVPYDISMIVFGCKPNPSIWDLINSIKSRDHWTSISCKYEFDDVTHRNFMPKDIIHRICKLFQDNPNMVSDKSYTSKYIYSLIGIDLSTMDSKTVGTFVSALSYIRHKKQYLDIVSQYDF